MSKHAKHLRVLVDHMLGCRPDGTRTHGRVVAICATDAKRWATTPTTALVATFDDCEGTADRSCVRGKNGCLGEIAFGCGDSYPQSTANAFAERPMTFLDQSASLVGGRIRGRPRCPVGCRLPMPASRTASQAKVPQPKLADKGSEIEPACSARRTVMSGQSGASSTDQLRPAVRCSLLLEGRRRRSKSSQPPQSGSPRQPCCRPKYRCDQSRRRSTSAWARERRETTPRPTKAG